MALGDTEGVVEINIAGNLTSRLLLPMLPRLDPSVPKSNHIGRQFVPLQRLDRVQHTVIDKAQAIFLSIDTRGFEMPVLRGAAGMLPHIHGLQRKMSLVPLYGGQVPFHVLLDWVTGRGFDLHAVIPGFLDHTTEQLL